MLKKIQQIVAVIVVGLLILSLRWCATPDYEEGFERQFLSIDDGLDIVEVVVVDLTEHGTQWLKPEDGYFLRLLGGDAPSDLINRFRDHPIARIQRGYVKHWADEKKRAQIEIKKIVEIDKSSASVYGVIRYPRGFVDDFEYLIKEESSHWIVGDRSISNRRNHGR